MTDEQPLMMRLPQVLKALNISKSQFYDMQRNADGRFDSFPPLPKPVKLSAKLVLFVTAEVLQWVADVAAMNAPKPAPAPASLDDAMRDLVRADR